MSAGFDPGQRTGYTGSGIAHVVTPDSLVVEL